MMGKATLLLVVSVVTVLVLQADVTWASECCRSYVDAFGRRHDSRWCPFYCCGSRVTALRCCADRRGRAPEYDREDWCATWFTAASNLWAPVLIIIVVVLILIGSIVCCVRCCCCAF